MAMIAITTRSSISVNPRDCEHFVRFDMFVLLMPDVPDLDDLLLQSNPIHPPSMRTGAGQKSNHRLDAFGISRMPLSRRDRLKIAQRFNVGTENLASLKSRRDG